MKAGAMVWRGGAISRPGKVDCVMHFGRRAWWLGGEGRSVHATAYCPRHVAPFASACLSRLSYNLRCADKGPCQGVHAQAHPYTPTGKGRVLRGAFSSTGHTGTGTGSGGGSRTQTSDNYETIKVGAIVVGTIAAISGPTAVAVHTYDQDKAATEIARIEDKIARIEDRGETEIARIEGDRKLSEQFWKAEVERFKHDLQLAHTQDYEPYQAAVSKKKKRKKRGGTGGLEKEEEKD